VRLSLPLAVALFLATGCGEKAQSASWFRISGEAGIGPSLSASDVDRRSAQATVDPATQAPALVFRFTPAGEHRFERLTRALARAGRQAGRPYHFDVLVDGRPLERPYVDYRINPGGLTSNGVQLTLARQRTAERLAKRLRDS
jgi:preprotein translocase subunit SecD